MKNQDELNRSNLAIATGDYAGDANGKGTIDDLLKGQEAGGDAPQPKTEGRRKLLSTL